MKPARRGGLVRGQKKPSTDDDLVDTASDTVYTTCMVNPIKRLAYEKFFYGDIVRLTKAVRGSSGKRFKFLGAVFTSEEDETPTHFELVEIQRGHLRSIRPEFVIKDVAPSKAAQARIARKAEK